MAVLAGKDQVTDRAVVVIAPTCQELNDVGDQVDVSSLTVLGRPDRAAREARPDANDRLLEIDVIPVEREQFSLAHSRFEGHQAQCSERLAPKVREEPRELAFSK